MKKGLVRWLFVMGVLVLVLACGTPAAAPTAAPDLNATMAAGVELTKQAMGMQEAPQAEVDTQATVDAQVQQTMDAQQQAEQEAASQATQAAMEATSQAMPAPTQPQEEVAAAPMVNEATQQAEPMYNLVSEMASKGNLWSADGEFHAIADFDERSFNTKEFEWWRTDHKASNFVIRANVTWRGSSSANPDKNGCGFMYGYSGMEYWHASFLDMDGTVHTYRQRGGGELIEMKGGKFPGGLGRSSGEAELILTVEDKLMTFYVNGMQVVRFKDPYINSGDVGILIATDSVEGMHCQMEDIWFWELK